MNLSNPLQAPAYQACLDEARRQAPLIAQRWFTQLADVLFEKSTAPAAAYEKRLMHEAWLALKIQQGAIEKGFALELSKAMGADIDVDSAKKSNLAAASFAALRFSDLELMDNAQVQDTLDEARLQQVFLLASDAGLSGFSARLSTAQGLKSVKLKNNPLRPEVFARALAALLAGLRVAPDVRARWLVYGAQLMGNELQQLYTLLNELLEKRGVQQAAYVVIPTHDQPRDKSSGLTGFQNGSGGSGGGTGDTGGAPMQSMQFYERFQESSFQASQPIPHESQGTGRSARKRPSREQLLTLDHLHRLMVGEYDDAFSVDINIDVDTVANTDTDTDTDTDVDVDIDIATDSGVALSRAGRPIYAPTTPAALGALVELQQNTQSRQALHAGLNAARQTPTRRSPSLPLTLLREQLKAGAKNLGQSLAIEVVGLMFEQLLSDERLLPPVRQVIANAEPAFLRLATADPRFFSDKSHPARRLLESVTAKALAYSAEDAPGFVDFMDDMKVIEDQLNQALDCDAEHFSALLQTFEDRQLARNRFAAQAQRLAVQALLLVEQRNLLAGKIAAEIKTRPDFHTSNPVVGAFVLGPWIQVLAKERLLGAHGELGQHKAVFSLTLSDLLWSLNPAKTAGNRKRLLKIIPGMLSSIRDGLRSVDFPLVQSGAFFDELMRLHEAALHPAAPTAAPPPATAQQSKDLGDAFAAQDFARGQQPWLAPEEARQSGFMVFDDDTAHQNDDASQTASSATQQFEPALDPAFQAMAEIKMHLGDWIELISTTRWVRARLTWISPHNTLFMFTSEGGRSHSMTGRVLGQLVAQGRLKIVSRYGLMDGAFDRVAQAAVRNSVALKSGD